MRRTIKFILPLRVKKTKTKLFSLNLNAYRNANYHLLSDVKNRFNRRFLMDNGSFDGEKMEKCALKYEIFFPDAQKTDLLNVGSIVDKFTSDCLVSYGYIPDDNHNIIKQIVFVDGGIDRDNPRAELTVTELS